MLTKMHPIEKPHECTCNSNTLQEAKGAASPLSPGKTALTTNEEEHCVNGKSG